MSQLSRIAKNTWYKEPQDINIVENDQGNGQIIPLHVMGKIFAADLDHANNTQTKDVVDMIHARNLSSRLLTIEDSTVNAMCPLFDNGSTSISQVETYPDYNFLKDPNDLSIRKC
ncbi:3235_t:CDS:2 [Funneliformis caledonium]|uniref:3235_t:CDS:1 n=1 Tax=Funneliformis caledonium TaxID=1117310 RepID=A0A9N8ZWZ3_9GLOM|nr:3235_t:CDS:2 [Funneliformis caledonium]